MFIVISCFAQVDDTTALGIKHRNLQKRSIDFSKTDQKIMLEDMQELRKRLKLHKINSIPPHLRKISEDLVENYLILIDQNISPEEFVKNKIYKKLWGGVETDSLGYINGNISFSPYDTTLQNERLSSLISNGVKIKRFYIGPGGFIVQCNIPIYQLVKISLLKDVNFIYRASKDIHNTNYITQGDKVMKADIARTLFNINSSNPNLTNPKVGIISDGVTNFMAVKNNGYLNQTINTDPSDGLGTGDEGTAMAEIINVIAPRANLYFRPSQGDDYNNAVQYQKLIDAGCKIIVDDITSTDAAIYADATWANKIEANKTSILAISSAGNYNDKQFWIGNEHITNVYVSADGETYKLQSFDDFGNNNFNRIIIPKKTKIRIILEWNDKWGNSWSDYDLYLQNSPYADDQYLVQRSIRAQSPSYDRQPLEEIIFDNSSGLSDLQYYLMVKKNYTYTASSLAIYVAKLGGDGVDNPNLQFSKSYNSIIGQAMAKSCISVGAVNHADKKLETFSGAGGIAPIFVYSDALFKTLDHIDYSRQSELPTVTGVDRVDTYVGQSNIWRPGYGANGFGGTSASAPHIAGIAALMISVNPSLSPSQIRTILAKSCEKVDASTNPYSTYGNEGAYRNQQLGYGMVNAYKALRDALPIQNNQSYYSSTNLIYKHLKGSTYIASSTEITVPVNSTVYLEGSLVGGNTASKISVYGTLIIAEGFVQNTAEIDGRNGTVIFEKDLSMTNNACFIVRSGGKLTIPEHGSMTADNGAFIVWSTGSTVEIGDNANIQVNYYNSSSRLQIGNGATIKLGTNANITSYAPILANGTSNQPISFTSLSGSVNPGSWGSIILTGSNAASSSINYCNFNYGSGIQFLNAANATIQYSTINTCTQGIYFYNAAPNIYYNLITNPSQNGIYGNSSSYGSEIIGNRIEKSSLSYSGINISNGGYGFIAQNDISGFDYGMYYGGGVGIEFTNEQYNGFYPNNRITGCYLGLVVGWGSYAYLVDAGYQGSNSIYGNYSLDVQSYQYSDVISNDNWWGGGNPTNYVDGTSTFYLGYVIPNDPWAPIEWSTVSTEEQRSILVGQSRENPKKILLDGFLLLKNKQYNTALDYFKSMLWNNQYPTLALRQILKLQNHVETKESAELFLDSFFASKKNRPDILRLAISVKLHREKYQEALILCDKLISEYPSTMEATDARFHKYFYAVHVEEDYKSANTQLQALNNLYSKSTDTKIKNDLEIAHYVLKNYLDPKEHNGYKKTVGQNNLLMRNYPNPFNPTTRISYTLPNAGNVVLKVYDILGKEVATLVNEFKETGQYDVEFNASKLASGMYIYKLISNNISEIKKMLLVK